MNPLSLREICAKATPGPWEGTSEPMIFKNEEGQNFSSGDWSIYPPLGEAGPVAIVGTHANAALIARFSPATALAVYEALEPAAKAASQILESPFAYGSTRTTEEASEAERGRGKIAVMFTHEQLLALRHASRLLDGRTEP